MKTKAHHEADLRLCFCIFKKMVFSYVLVERCKQWLKMRAITDTQLKSEKSMSMNFTVLILSFRTDRYGQTVQTQVKLLLEEQFDLGLRCLLFHLHLFDKIP